MGNHSATPSANENITRNFSDFSGGGHCFFCWDIFTSFTDMMSRCDRQTDQMVWFGLKIFLLVTALPTNTCLMWILLRSKKTLTPSELLGLNISIMDLLYCFCLPLDFYQTLHHTPKMFHSVYEALFALNIFGCPLLLTFMCLERFVAAAFPIVYMRLGKWEYRIALCVFTWLSTLAVALMNYFVMMFTKVLYLAAVISVMFAVMLLCLVGIVRVLCQDGPCEGVRTSTSLKKRALKNILAVTVPSIVAYSPLVAVVPYTAVIVSTQSEDISPDQCNILHFLLAFPNFGLYIGPMFYLSRLRQLICGRTEKPNTNSKTQAD